jgi:signal transduction histidine kinase
MVAITFAVLAATTAATTAATNGVATPTGAASPESLASAAYLWVLPFALFRWGSGSEAIAGAVIVAGKICLFAAVGWLSVAEMLLGFVVLVAVFALAAAFRFRATLWARELDHARLVQREQLARDLNDTVAHHVSAMAVSAQAGLAAPGAARDSLQMIEAEATRALAEMRSMVHTLRHDKPD